MKSKIKVAFELVYNWDLAIFRDYMLKLSQCEEIELYIITESLEVGTIESAMTLLNISEDKVVYFTTFEQKVDAISTIDADIFMEGDFSEFSTLEQLSLSTFLIYVDYKLDRHYNVQRFIIEIMDQLNTLKRERNIC